MHQSTSGGSSDTEVNELTVMPVGFPDASSAVMTVTPVAKLPKAWRRAAGLKFDFSVDIVVCVLNKGPPCWIAYIDSVIGLVGMYRNTVSMLSIAVLLSLLV